MNEITKEKLPFFQKTVCDFSGDVDIGYPPCGSCGNPYLPILSRFTREGLRVCPTCFLKLGLTIKRGQEEAGNKNHIKTEDFLPLPYPPSVSLDDIKVLMRESNG